MFTPFPFVIFWPFVQILYLATSKLLPNYLKKLVSLPLIFYCWTTFFLLPVHSSSLPHLFSPFLCLRSILLHFFTLFYTGKVYVLFQHTLLSLIPYFALFNWSCRIFVSRMTMKKRKKKKNVCNGENVFLFTPTAALAESRCHCFPTELAFPNLGIPISLFDRIFLFFSQKVCIFQMPVTYHYRISQE